MDIRPPSHLEFPRETCSPRNPPRLLPPHEVIDCFNVLLKELAVATPSTKQRQGSSVQHGQWRYGSTRGRGYGRGRQQHLHAQALATGIDGKDPISDGTECDRTMMHDHQHRQTNLQIVQIVLPARSQRVHRRETVAQA